MRVVRRQPSPSKIGDSSDLFRLSPLVGFDVETTGLSPWHGDRAYSFAFVDDQDHEVYFRWPVDRRTREVTPNPRDLENLKRWISNRKWRLVMHNGKFERRMVEVIGCDMHWNTEETVFSAHALNNIEINYELKRLCKAYDIMGDADQKELQDSTKRARNQIRQAVRAWWKSKYGKTPFPEDWYDAKLKACPGWVALAEKVAPDYWLGDPGLCRKYNILDGRRTRILFQMHDALMDDEGVRSTYQREQLLAPVTYSLETRGIRVSLDIVDREIKHHRSEFQKVAREVTKMGRGVNVDSPKQLKHLLYGPPEKGGFGLIPVLDKDEKVSTGFAARKNLDHPFIPLLNKYRSHEKALSSFFEKYSELAVPDHIVEDSDDAWCIHGNFNQVGPVTGRFSARQPNLQNVASAVTTRSTEPIQARNPFGPRPGYVWLHADYSQLEVRIFAGASQERFMLDALESGRDLHGECANKCWGTACKNGESLAQDRALRAAANTLGVNGSANSRDPKIIPVVKEVCRKVGTPYLSPGTIYDHTVSEKMSRVWLDQHGWDIVAAEKSVDKKNTRTNAKFVLFLKVFGGGPKSLKDLLLCSMSEAKQILEDYDEAFPRIKEYMSVMVRAAERDGFTINAYGRKLRTESDYSYRAVNHYVQSSAADLLKDRMIALHKHLQGQDAHLVLTIHDEVVIEVRKDLCTPAFMRGVKWVLEQDGSRFGTPIIVELDLVEEGKSWADKTPIEKLGISLKPRVVVRRKVFAGPG